MSLSVGGRNAILGELARQDPAVYAELAADLHPFALQRGHQLGAGRERTDWVYFLESGIVSLVAATSGGNTVAVALVGREGAAGVGDILGIGAMPYRLIVQLPGLAYRIRTGVVRNHIFTCTPLHELLMAHVQAMMQQLAQSAVCNRFHTSVQRLARWLLLTSERAEATRLEFTHEFVAELVGAPRSAVTHAAAELRKNGSIEYQRGSIRIRNIKRLKKASCECFGVLSALQPPRGD